MNFLEASKDYQGGDNFPQLLSEGLLLAGPDFAHEIAKELEIIPASIKRWAMGIGLPLPGFRVIVIQKLRRRVEELSKVEPEP